MDQKKMKRHTLVCLTRRGRERLYEEMSSLDSYHEPIWRDLWRGIIPIPGIIRRSDSDADQNGLAIGFVHPKRSEGKRYRYGTYIAETEVQALYTPYEVLAGCKTLKRTDALRILAKVLDYAAFYNVELGILGSVGLEIFTGLPYSDEKSDLDMLVKPASLDTLRLFYENVCELSRNINMDFEVELPNGYGIKLQELVSSSSTLLGKGLNDIQILTKKDVVSFLV